MSLTTVWAFKPLKELDNQTGFVACDRELAEKLIEAGKAQNPQVGANHLKHIQSETKITKDVKDAEKATKAAKPKAKAK